VEATLEPLLGEGRFRVGVTADCDFSTSEQTDEVYDPTRSVMSSSQKTEDLSQGSVAGGVPGTPSNLPRSQIKSQATGPGGTTVSRRTENTSFETSRTVRQVKIPRGVIKKISAALLIDQDVEWQGTGKQRKRVFIPPSVDKLKAIHDVVAGVLGISADRGDQLIVETLPFEQTRNSEDGSAGEMAAKPGGPAAKTMLNGLLAGDKKTLMGAGGGLLVLVLLLGFLLRRRTSSKDSVELDEKPVILPGRSDNQATGDSGRSKQVEGAGPTMTEEPHGPGKELEDGFATMLLPEMTGETKTLLDSLRRSIGKDPDVAANVVRAWMDEQ
jgi:flagellar M-ring protein FliF